MMFCLRSFIPLLLLPLPPSLSPVHLILLFSLTYFLNRPCIYCSFLLLILFASSCYWSDRCFIDFYTASDVNSWFEPRIGAYHRDKIASAPGQEDGTIPSLVNDMVNSTAGIVLGAAMEGAKATLASLTSGAGGVHGPTGGGQDVVGLGWLRSLLGRTEWTLPCLNVQVRL